MQTIAPTTSLTLEDRFELRQRLAATKDAIERELKETNEAIKDEMIRQGIDEYTVGDQKLVLSVRPGRRTLDRAELIAQGVSVALIDAATKQGKEYTQLDVRKA